MNPKAVFVLVSLLALAGAVLGSTIAILAGRDNAIVAMDLGGAGGLVLSVTLAIRFGWLSAAVQDGAVLGGLVGLAFATVLVVATISTIVLPFFSFALVGAGVLAGANRSANSDKGVA